MILALTCFGVSAFGRAVPSERLTQDSSETPLRLALLPLANYTGQAEAAAVFTPLIEDHLKQGNFRLIAAADIERELRKYRIRSTATIGQNDAAKLAGAMGIDYFMLGSIDIFMAGAVPEAAISMRAVDPGDMSVIWAVSVAANGHDYVKMLGLGRVSSMEELAQRLVKEALFNLESGLNLQAADRQANQSKPRHALVIFDNLSDNKFAGDIITMIAISDLAANKIRILEPGAALELFRQNGEFPRGEIDKNLLRQLYDKFGVARVITGSVDLLRTSNEGGEATPEVELGGRYLDAATGKVLAASEVDRRGTDSETLFKLGITYSLGRLARDATHTFLEKLHVFEK